MGEIVRSLGCDVEPDSEGKGVAFLCVLRDAGYCLEQKCCSQNDESGGAFEFGKVGVGWSV